MKKISKRLSALFLSVVTVLSVFVFPVTASAAEVGEQDQRSVVELQAVNSTVTPQEDSSKENLVKYVLNIKESVYLYVNKVPDLICTKTLIWL